MGVYDTINIENRCGQVKLWGSDMEVYSKGDSVPPLDPTNLYESYSILMREGGAVNIKNGVIDSWTNEPTEDKVVDKWGVVWDYDVGYFFA